MRISDWSSDVCSSDLLERRVIGEGAMFDAVDARRGRGGDAARAVGVRHDLEAERMGGVGDALEFGAGEMAFEPARLLRQYRSEERRGGEECGSTFKSRW